MSGAPSVAVNVVTFESEHVIGECLRRLRAAADASDVSCSATVVDNASTDATVDRALEAWPETRVLRQDTNLGYIAAANRGVEGATSDWLLFLNPDAFVGPDLFTFLEAVDRHPEVASFSPLFTDVRGVPVRTVYRWPTVGKELARLSGALSVLGRMGVVRSDRLPARSTTTFPPPVGDGLRVDYPAGACWFIRREAWERVGAFDEGFYVYHEDMEWCLRATRLGLATFVFPGCRVEHAGGQSAHVPLPRSVVWHYAGLLHFYEVHGSPAKRAVLRAAMAASFGARTLAAGARGRDTGPYREVLRLATRGS
ncbi:MAG: glycosyltransferase family 2 protein [Actinomycetota bacterium]